MWMLNIGKLPNINLLNIINTPKFCNLIREREGWERLWKKVCKYRSSMIMMGERLENKLFALALCIAVTDGYVKHSRHPHSVLESIPTNALHTWSPVPHRPVPNSVSSSSISSLLQKLPDTELLAMLYRLGIRSAAGSASGMWNSGIRWHWSCIWLSWQPLKT